MYVSQYCVRNKGEQVRKIGFAIAVVAGVLGAVLPSSLMMLGASLAGSLGWIGIAFSVFVVVLGVVALKGTSWIPGALLIVCATAGSILGGPFVAVYLVWAILGGMLALFGQRIFGSKRPLSS